MKRLAPLALGLAVALLGVSGRPLAYADLAKLVAAHPLYPVILQDDRQIAAYESMRTAPLVARLSASTMEPPGGQGFPVLRPVGTSSFRRRISDQMHRYTAELQREENAALRAYATAIAARANAAYANRVQEYREGEAAWEYHAAREDAGRLLHIRVRLQTLVLTGAERARLTREQAAIRHREAAGLAALRRVDDSRLAAIRARLDAIARSDYGQKATQTRAGMAANLAARERVMRSELAAAGNARDGARVPSRSAVLAEYRATNAALIDGIAQVRTTQNADRTGANAALSAVKASRARLYAAIVLAVERLARNTARARGLGAVTFTGPRPPGSVDLTSSLLASLGRASAF